jgi:hypothetical protein
LLVASGVHAQASPGGGQVTTPGSSIEKPGDSGVRAHTNIEIFRPNRASGEEAAGEPMKSQRLHMTLPALLGAATLVAITPRDAYSEWAARGGHTVTPESSIEQPEHVGLRAHTNFKMFVPAAGMAARQDSPEAVPQAGGPPFHGYFYETPASLACV